MDSGYDIAQLTFRPFIFPSVSVSLRLCLSSPLPFLSLLSLPPYISSLPLPLHEQNFTVCWKTSYMFYLLITSIIRELKVDSKLKEALFNHWLSF